MKELSIEEKAKRYDEAIAKGKQIQNTPYTAHWDIMKEVVEHLLPELKESEDERIVNALIGYIEGSVHDVNEEIIPGIKISDAIAWLEKQGEHANFLNNIQIGDKVTRNEDGVLVNLSQLNRVAKKYEKQGEQKHQYNSRPRYIGEEELLGTNKQGKCHFSKQELIDMGFAFTQDGDLAYPIHKIEKKEFAAWSEEDEKILSNIIKDLVHPWNEYIPDRIEDEIKWLKNKLKSLKDRSAWKPSDAHYELEEFAKIVRGNLTGISKAVQKLFEAKYLQLTGNKMYGGFKD